MKEFKVNEYISLKLENNKTVIYVAGKRFMQCKYLLLVNPLEQENQLEINSIDEAAEVLSLKLEKEVKPIELGITPEEEFWGHCSNIQAWVENNYDTRLLHSNLAFSLLLELSRRGEKEVEYIFKEEVAKRISHGNPNVLSFLLEQGYDAYLTNEEFLSCRLLPKEANAILNLESLLGIELVWMGWKCNESRMFLEKNKHVIEINLSNLNLNYIPEILIDLPQLKTINLSNNNIKTVPNSILHNLTQLKELNLHNNPISIAKKEKIKQLRPDLKII